MRKNPHDAAAHVLAQFTIRDLMDGLKLLQAGWDAIAPDVATAARTRIVRELKSRSPADLTRALLREAGL